MNGDEYDAWFRAKVQEALSSTGPKHSRETAMANAEAAVRRVMAEREHDA